MSYSRSRTKTAIVPDGNPTGPFSVLRQNATLEEMTDLRDQANNHPSIPGFFAKAGRTPLQLTETAGRRGMPLDYNLHTAKRARNHGTAFLGLAAGDESVAITTAFAKVLRRSTLSADAFATAALELYSTATIDEFLKQDSVMRILALVGPRFPTRILRARVSYFAPSTLLTMRDEHLIPELLLLNEDDRRAMENELIQEMDKIRAEVTSVLRNLLPERSQQYDGAEALHLEEEHVQEAFAPSVQSFYESHPRLQDVVLVRSDEPGRAFVEHDFVALWKRFKNNDTGTFSAELVAHIKSATPPHATRTVKREAVRRPVANDHSDSELLIKMLSGRNTAPPVVAPDILFRLPSAPPSAPPSTPTSIATSAPTSIAPSAAPSAATSIATSAACRTCGGPVEYAWRSAHNDKEVTFCSAKCMNEFSFDGETVDEPEPTPDETTMKVFDICVKQEL